MDFMKTLKKDGKPDGLGHYDWEKPGLRARVEAERKAAAPKTENPMLKSWYSPSGADVGMQQRDLPKGKL